MERILIQMLSLLLCHQQFSLKIPHLVTEFENVFESLFEVCVAADLKKPLTEDALLLNH